MKCIFENWHASFEPHFIYPAIGRVSAPGHVSQTPDPLSSATRREPTTWCVKKRSGVVLNKAAGGVNLPGYDDSSTRAKAFPCTIWEGSEAGCNYLAHRRGVHLHDTLGSHHCRRVHEVAQGRPELGCEHARTRVGQHGDRVPSCRSSGALGVLRERAGRATLRQSPRSLVPGGLR